MKVWIFLLLLSYWAHAGSPEPDACVPQTLVGPLTELQAQRVLRKLAERKKGEEEQIVHDANRLAELARQSKNMDQTVERAIELSGQNRTYLPSELREMKKAIAILRERGMEDRMDRIAGPVQRQDYIFEKARRKIQPPTQEEKAFIDARVSFVVGAEKQFSKLTTSTRPSSSKSRRTLRPGRFSPDMKLIFTVCGRCDSHLRTARNTELFTRLRTAKL